MLLGEHAVLHGRRALVCAINKRITVSVFQCSDPSEAREAPRTRGSDRRERQQVVRIVSDLGTYEAPLNALTDHPDFRFVLDAVKQYPLTQGVELKIESEFSSEIGFGSSAAVTVATHAALMHFPRSRTSATKFQAENCRAGAVTPPFDKDELFKRSLATIHRVQGRGSGADVAASVFGGVVAYRAEPLEIHPLTETFPLTAVYSGAKMKTADVIRHLEERRALNANYFERIFDRMDASVGEVIGDFSQLGRMLVLNQKLMEEMGLCNAALAEIIEGFQTLKVPAKISGSGLGDCAIGLGKIPKIGNFKTFALQVESCGVSAQR